MRRMMLGAVIAMLLAHAVPAAAAPPLGSNGHGVRMVARHGTLSLVLSTAMHARLTGRQLSVDCFHLYHEADSPLLGIGTVDENLVRVPVLMGPIATGIRRAHRDVCLISRPGNSEHTIANIALTPRGAFYLAQQQAVVNVYAFSLEPLPWYVRRSKRLFRRLHAVRLTREGELPPGHRLGLYITLKHLYAAQRDPHGTLLFFQRDGRTITTNLMPPLASLF